MLSRRPLFLFAATAGMFLGAFTASADLLQTLPELGDLQRWAVFTLGDGVDADELAGNTSIQGDVGVAGNGNINVTGNAIVHGDVYYRSNGRLKVRGNG